MTTSLVNVRMDDATKKAFAEVCEQMGMNISTAFNIFAKAVVRERGIPFEVSADPFYSSENMRHLNRSLQQLEGGRSAAHELVEP